jgi:serine/threonine protein phosphatase 1
MPVRALFRALRSPSAASKPRIPEGQRVYAIGDVHGRHDLVEQLAAAIDADSGARGPADVQIIFLGDLVDRGPASKEVIDELIDLRARGIPVRCLIGNHDAVFLRVLEGDHRAARFLIRMGGKSTLMSYGITEAEYQDLDYPDLTRRIGQLAPPSHVEFLKTLDQKIEVGDYVFVHAGLRPGVLLEDQAPEDLFWIRDEFLRHNGNFCKFVVHGHSITEEVDIRSNRIGIDTGAYDTGRLTAIGLEGTDRWFLTT